MSNTVDACRTVKVFTFRGNRGAFAARFVTVLDNTANRSGPDVNTLDRLLYAGHTGVSPDLGTTIYGFNPNGGGMTNWRWASVCDEVFRSCHLAFAK